MSLTSATPATSLSSSTAADRILHGQWHYTRPPRSPMIVLTSSARNNDITHHWCHPQADVVHKYSQSLTSCTHHKHRRHFLSTEICQFTRHQHHSYSADMHPRHPMCTVGALWSTLRARHSVRCTYHVTQQVLTLLRIEIPHHAHQPTLASFYIHWPHRKTDWWRHAACLSCSTFADVWNRGLQLLLAVIVGFTVTFCKSNDWRVSLAESWLLQRFATYILLPESVIIGSVFTRQDLPDKLTFLCSLKSWILCTFDDVIASSCHHFLPSDLSIVSPGYNRNGWLGVTYLLTLPLSNAFSWLYMRSHWLPMQRQVLTAVLSSF